MVGHLAHWESTVPAFVDSLRTGTPREAALLVADDGGGDVDEQNARAAAEARGLSRDEVLRRWDDAHAEMLEVARTLSDVELEELSGRLGDVPAALRAMKRLWPEGNGLRDRREREAKLFEEGLA